MRRITLVALCAFLCARLACAELSREGSSFSAGSVGTRNQELQQVLRDPTASDASMSKGARDVFQVKGTDPSVDLRLSGWAHPGPWRFKDRESADPTMDGLVKALVRINSRIEAPPELSQTLQLGERISKEYAELDAKSFGLFMYTMAYALRIHIDKHFQEEIQLWLGNEIASLTLAHELYHHLQFVRGELSPSKTKEAEKGAYRFVYDLMTRARNWRLAQQKREARSWAKSTLCSDEATFHAPEKVCKYVDHLLMIQKYGDDDDFDGLVNQLGYHNHPDPPAKRSPQPTTL